MTEDQLAANSNAITLQPGGLDLDVPSLTWTGEYFLRGFVLELFVTPRNDQPSFTSISNPFTNSYSCILQGS